MLPWLIIQIYSTFTASKHGCTIEAPVAVAHHPVVIRLPHPGTAGTWAYVVVDESMQYKYWRHHQGASGGLEIAVVQYHMQYLRAITLLHWKKLGRLYYV